MKQIPITSEDFWSTHDAEVIACRKCTRLVAWREKVAIEKRKAYLKDTYWGKPVPGFGDHNAQILVVGLAPGAHGSNRTGRMFTGDASGVFLFEHLYRSGFASAPRSIDRLDSLQLINMYITAACRCVPPDNKPNPDEIANCQPFLMAEFQRLPLRGIVALGRLGYEQSIKLVYPNTPFRNFSAFKHGAVVETKEGHPWILASYHPSRQNTQTGKLTSEMFASIWEIARKLL